MSAETAADPDAKPGGTSPDVAGAARTKSPIARLALVLGAAALLASPRYPYWGLRLEAPQYPKGLSLAIHPHKVTGDVDEIDGLNHYIGMRKIGDAAPLERRLGVPAVVAIACGLLAAAAWGSRASALLVLPAIAFPALFLADLYWWLRDSGLGLDPKAAFSSSIKPFVPTLLGMGKIAQFRTFGTLGAGYYLCAFAGATALFYGVQAARPPRRRRAGPGLAATAAMAAMAASPAGAATLAVTPGAGPTLAQAIERAAPGDTIIVRGGVHPGPVVVRKTLRLVGEGRPVLDGRGRGTVVRLEAPDCELRGFEVRGSGDTLAAEDVGVLVAAPGGRVVDNWVHDVLFGIYLRQAPRGVVRGNTLRGKDLPVARRGDLIRLWYSDDATVEDNSTEGGRDVVLWYSGRIAIRGNAIRGGRYGLHFMYCNDASVVGNRLSGNSVGAFLMYSARLTLEKNWFVENRGVSGYGVGLKDMEDCRVVDNVLAANKVGLFMEHARGEVAGNLIAGNDKGVALFTSAQGNRIESNAFVENGEQVEIEGFSGTMTTNLWRGNYWSDYRGYDADGDGTGDQPYRPARLFERVAEHQPALRLFAEGPAARAIDFAAGLFPIFEPQAKFSDERPRMEPPHPPLVMVGAGAGWEWALLGAALLGGPAALVLGGASPLGGSKAGARPAVAGIGDDEAGGGPAGPRPTAIAVEGLTKRFGEAKAVDALDLTVGSGETVVLWGPNGAGKTTVLRCLLGLLPCEGSLAVMGQPCGPRGRDARRAVGYVPQDVRLHPDDTVAETVRFYARLRGVDPGRGVRLLGEWGLGDVGRRPVRNLSGGMRQKLALVVALLADPPVLLLDEPTSNLDAAARREFAALLLRLKAAGKTLVFCTHRPSEVWKLADRVVVLERGRKVAEGSPEAVRGHLTTAASLGLTVPGDRAGDAAEALAGAGFAVERTGSRVWVGVVDGRKVEALERLRLAGIPVLDFDVEAEPPASGPATEGGTAR